MFAGHELHVVDEATRTDPDALAAYVVRHHIDCVDVTPSYMQVLVSRALLEHHRWRPSVIVLGGEPVPGQLWDELRSAGCEAFSIYGLTESGGDALLACVGDSTSPVIGRPMAATWAYVLDAGLEPVAPGQAGELYIAGAGPGPGLSPPPWAQRRAVRGRPLWPARRSHVPDRRSGSRERRR